MGNTAEHVAQVHNVSREEQDTFAFKSQKKYKNAFDSNFFKEEIVPIKLKIRREEKILSQDEYPRMETTLEGLAKLKPCFLKESGTVTPGNASGINDGAAMVQMCSLHEAKLRNLQPLCRIVSWAQYGAEPMLMGVAPIECIKKALEKANWSLDGVDLFEINEAFSSQSCAILRELHIDESRVNVNGGSIALGHPIGCSGARVLVTLIHELIRSGKKKGLAALCIGGGMSICMCIERV
jgi:acetyl-CoA C-acetyltransferase